jgi:hypothetical protein
MGGVVTTTTLPLTLSEADFQRTVIDYAVRRQWRVTHYRAALTRSGRWSTPLAGHPGAPDLILARGGVVLLAELKRHGGQVSPEQRLWLAALGPAGRLWTPKDWPAIYEELR